jgi:hypothetical protein
MTKIDLQNLLAIFDLAQKAGVINPEDMIPAGIARKKLVDLLAQMSEDTQKVVVEKANDKPNAAKEKTN